MITHVLQCSPQTIGLCCITKKLKALAYEFSHFTIIFTIKVVRSKDLTTLQHFSHLFGRLTLCTLITEDTDKVGGHHATDSPTGRVQRVDFHLSTTVTSIIGIGVL